MLGLFETFALKRMQLKHAVIAGDDDLVCLLDKELEPIIDDIVAYRATTREDVHKQLQFINSLIRDEADDKGNVLRRTAAVSALIDRYLMGDGKQQERPIAEPRIGRPAVNQSPEQPLLNEAILDGLPDRVGVITTDYRYLYTNNANAKYLGRTAFSMVGSHVSEFIGDEGFQLQAKPAFDKCFAGEKVDYVHHGRFASRVFETRCRLTPLRSGNDHIIGAVMVLQPVENASVLAHHGS